MASENFIPGTIEIRARNVQIAYDKFVAFSATKLQIPGRVIGIIGHNGSGKSTLLKALLKLLEPKQGQLNTYWIENEKQTLLIPEKHMAFSPENGAVFEDMPVESYVKLWCRLKQHDANYYKGKGSYCLERLNITPLLPKLGRELSKGQRRRVQAAVGFLSSPRLFLFDEPFDGLDLSQSNDLSLTMLAEAGKMAMIVSSHHMEVIERLADFVVVLKDGKVFAAGGVDEICFALGGRTVAISFQQGQKPSFNGLLPLLQREFCSCLINQIGDQIHVTGPDATVAALQLFLSQQQLNGLDLHAIRPSLGQAMHCHLIDF